MPCDAVSIYTWFQHHKLDLEGHMYTNAYHSIVTQIGVLKYCCVRCNTWGTHGWTCTRELAANGGIKVTTYWLTTAGIKLGLWVGSAVWLVRWLSIDSRSVTEEQLHHEAAVSSEGEASLSMCFAVLCVILYHWKRCTMLAILTR